MKEVKLIGELKSEKKSLGVFAVTGCEDITFIEFQNFESAMYPNPVIGPRSNGKLFTSVDTGYLPMDRIFEIIEERVKETL